MPQKLRIEYFVKPDPSSLARSAAQYIVGEIQKAVSERGNARIAISGGSTPKAALQLLANPFEPFYAQMPWDRIHLYWADERCVPPDDAESNFHMTNEALLSHVPLQPHQIHRMEGELDPEVAAARYESELRNTFRLEGAESPQFDLVALGMGSDGHTASIFPYTEAVHEMGRLVTANHIPQKNNWRITLTWPVINHANSVFFLIAGEDKAAVLKEVLSGPRDPERLPSQLIWPSRGILTLLLDQAATTHLPAPNAQGFGFLERER